MFFTSFCFILEYRKLFFLFFDVHYNKILAASLSSILLNGNLIVPTENS